MNGTLSPELLAEVVRALNAAGLDLPLVEDEWLTVSEAMVVAGVSRTRLYEWMREGLPFLDLVPRQIRRSALLQFKADREVVMVRSKKVPVDRSAATAPETKAAPRKRKVVKPRTSVAASGGTDRAALLALVNEARKAAG